MNKTAKILFYKKQIRSARELIILAEQNIALATRIESEATSALTMLGAKSGHSRKGIELSNETQNNLRASLTK